MSLWFESFGESLDNCGNDQDKKVRCIIKYLSMPVPRLWWEKALTRGIVNDSYIRILQDCYRELIKIPGAAGVITLGNLIALPFIEGHSKEDESIPLDVYLRESFSRVDEIIANNPELGRLAAKIQTKAQRR